ncbi:MAG: hypothetical protein LOD88_08850 [Novibacillus thermophilus]|jgi:DNA uptake protein ComE-like DNA-binding protein|uniref:Uncharacterized protein n=1 Tax=Novibacillus thermophilus TaxID=1471761 RepID=A0A1U9K472_9BACL|nr:hypothetical protein [Novibacillus thermophilus]AQS54832.1 hypothetical protein B0W44_02665 [Novibacillus thermophilus]
MARIMELTGLSAQAAGVVLLFIDVASTVGLLMSLTGIGLTAASAIIAYRATIRNLSKQAAIAL